MPKIVAKLSAFLVGHGMDEVAYKKKSLYHFLNCSVVICLI